MNPIDPAELSALMDGELTPERAAEVRAAIAQDAGLKAEFDRLQGMDADWRAAASGAAFRPRVDLAAGAAAWPAALWVLGLCVLTALRFLPKLIDAALLGTALHGAAFAIIVVWVIRALGRSGVALEGAAPDRQGR